MEQDYKNAFTWYEKAAKQGYAYAQYMLGLCYEEAKGVEHDQQWTAALSYHCAAWALSCSTPVPWS